MHRAKMVRPMKGHPTLQLHGDGIAEHDNRVRILPLEKLEDITDNKARADYKPEGSGFNEEPEAPGEKEDSKAKYISMELP